MKGNLKSVMENNNETFSYNYSAKQQDEVKKIRQKYVSTEEDKMETLRRLDRSVTDKGCMASLVVGMLSALVLGLGMCMCLVWEIYIPGVIIGLFGIAGVCAAYPLYIRIIKKERERIAPEILRLTDELMK